MDGLREEQLVAQRELGEGEGWRACAEGIMGFMVAFACRRADDASSSE